jgi:cytochrome c
MRRRAALTAICAITFAASLSAHTPELRLGHVASPAQIRRSTTTVFPNGAGLPVGSGTAIRGARIFRATCAACHGAHGQGSGWFRTRLIGGRGSLKSVNPILTIGSYWPYSTSLWDYIHRAMPYTSPGSLSNNEIYALTAFLLYENGIIGKAQVMNQDTLAKVRMPNRSGFVRYTTPEVHCSKSRARRL